MRKLATLAFLSFPSLAAAPSVRPLSVAEFRDLVKQCAPDAPLSTLRAIAKVESAFHPLAISINHPEKATATLGLDEGTVSLSRQPTTVREAIQWTKWLYSRGLTVSIGLMQVNAEHLAGRGLFLEQAFEPCTNLKTAWAILNDKYRTAAAVLGKGQLALSAAISAYNTGSMTAGIGNGYVQRVIGSKSRAKPQAQAGERHAPLPIGSHNNDSIEPIGETIDEPDEAPTGVPWVLAHR
jgi:type IV secretion system protein VirB1